MWLDVTAGRMERRWLLRAYWLLVPVLCLLGASPEWSKHLTSYSQGFRRLRELAEVATQTNPPPANGTNNPASSSTTSTTLEPSSAEAGVAEGEAAGEPEVEKSEGGEKEEEAVSPVTSSIAVMLFGFLVVNTLMLYLANYPDADLRQYTFKMISSMVSIFGAVLVNNALFTFILVQVLASPFPRGFGLGEIGHRGQFITGYVILTIAYANIYVFCTVFQTHLHRQVAAKIVSAHLCAFAGIKTFGELQQGEHVRWSLTMVAGVAGLAWLVLVIYRSIAPRVYNCLFPRRAEHCLELIKEGEDEATVLILSYLVLQSISFLITGSLPSFEGTEEHYDEFSVRAHFYASCVFFVLMMVATYFRATIKLKQKKPLHRFIGRNLFNLQNMLVMCMAWSLLRMGDWQFQMWLVSDADLAHVVNAFAMSLFAVVAIIGFDFFADYLTEEKPDGSESMSVDQTDTDWDSDDVDPFRVLKRNQRNLEKNLERSIRQIIDGYGLLVGLAWEKAFDAALDTIVEGVEKLKAHPVLSKIGLSILLVVFVFPAWVMYIVPKALKRKEDYQKDIERERLRREERKALTRSESKEHMDDESEMTTEDDEKSTSSS